MTEMRTPKLRDVRLGGAHLGGWAGAAGAGKQRGFRVMCLPPQ